MSDQPFNQQQPHDPGARQGLLNEALLCDLVEGVLSESKAASTRAVLARDGALLSTIEQIEHDRAALRALGDQMCPADLFSRLEPMLERDQLLSHEASEPHVHELRRGSGVVVKRARTWRIPALVSSAAAAILVVAGVVIFAQMLMARMPVNATRLAQQPSSEQPADLDPMDSTLGVRTATGEDAPAVADDGSRLATGIVSDRPLIDEPVRAAQLAQAGALQIRVKGGESSRLALVAMNMQPNEQANQQTERAWSFEGLADGANRSPLGPVFCSVYPTPGAIRDLAAAMRTAGLQVTLEQIQPTKAVPMTTEDILWWEQRSTWTHKRASVPVLFDE